PPHAAQTARPLSRYGETRSAPDGRPTRRPSRVKPSNVEAARARRRSTAHQSSSETIRSSGESRSLHSDSGGQRRAFVPRLVIFRERFQTTRPAYSGRRMISRIAVGAQDPVPWLGGGTPSAFRRFAIRVSPAPSAYSVKIRRTM